MSDQDNYEFAESAPVTGPGVMRDAETNHRVRPAASRLDRIPRSRRVAEIICHRTRQRPALVGIVIGSRDAGRVVLSEQIGGDRSQVGQDVLAPCRCGVDHVIDGAKLRSALLALPAKNRRVPRIDVVIIERPGALG
jgi:hypothetical protein